MLRSFGQNQFYLKYYYLSIIPTTLTYFEIILFKSSLNSTLKKNSLNSSWRTMRDERISAHVIHPIFLWADPFPCTCTETEEMYKLQYYTSRLTWLRTPWMSGLRSCWAWGSMWDHSAGISSSPAPPSAAWRPGACYTPLFAADSGLDFDQKLLKDRFYFMIDSFEWVRSGPWLTKSAVFCFIINIAYSTHQHLQTAKEPKIQQKQFLRQSFLSLCTNSLFRDYGFKGPKERGDSANKSWESLLGT